MSGATSWSGSQGRRGAARHDGSAGGRHVGGRGRVVGASKKRKRAAEVRASAAPGTKQASARAAQQHQKQRHQTPRHKTPRPTAKRHSAKLADKAVLSPPIDTPKPRLADALGKLQTHNAFTEIPPPGQIRLVVGRSGDHAAVYHMLLAVFQGPSRDEFYAQTEDPFYEPSDRLLVKRGHRVLSHLQLARRTMRFGQVDIPITRVQWLATLPEFRSQGFGARLLVEADRRIAADGGLVGVARTGTPRFFGRCGWAVCGRHSCSRANALEVLGRLHAERAGRPVRPLNIRRWRHVEMPALLRIYRQNTQAAYGPLERTEAYWRWLIGRGAYDSLLVAIDGRDRFELDEATAPIVGYAVLRKDHVVELLTAPGHHTADAQLLARACSESVEHDRQKLVVGAPPNHKLHQIVGSAGGVYCNSEADRGEVFMMKILDPLKLLATLRPELDARAKQADLRRGTELGLHIDTAKWRLIYTPRGFRVRTGQLGRRYLTLNRAEFTRLVMGHGSVREAVDAGRARASASSALELAEVLFPRLPLWHPAWDDLPA